MQSSNRLAYTARILLEMEAKKAKDDSELLLRKVSEMQQLLRRFPECERCGKPLVDGLWDICNEVLCDSCASDAYRHKDIEGYMRHGND